MTSSLERELKLIAPTGCELPPMSGAVPGLTDGPPAHRELEATYYDTKDLALARAGATVRFRAGEDGPPWTVRLPGWSAGAALARPEIRFAGNADTVPSDARDLVRAYVRTHRLRPVARLHVTRTSVPLFDDEGTRVAELVDDVVEGRRGEAGPVTRFREVELELTAPRHGRRLQRVAQERLTAAGCRAEPPRPKVLRVLGEAAEAPAEVVITPLGDAPTVLEAIRHALAVALDRLIRHDAGLRLGEDAEDVHQFRVAARTLRSQLKTFAAVLDPEWSQVLRAELGWLGTAAGELRDLDVLGQRLRASIAALDEADAAAAVPLLDHLEEQRGHARAQALTAVRCHRYDGLLDALVQAAAAPQVSDAEQAAAPARAFLRRAARTQLRRLDRIIAALPERPDEQQLHLVRIQAKRTRYAIEAARPVVGRAAARPAAALAHLQDVLGEFHDSVVAADWLRAAARERPAGALPAGLLIATEHAQQERIRLSLPDAWWAVSDPRVRRWP